MLSKKSLYFIGYASGEGGRIKGAGESPEYLKNSTFMNELSAQYTLNWGRFISSDKTQNTKLEIIKTLSQQLADAVTEAANQKKQWIVLGGDHTCAIGTWSGVYNAYKKEGDIGLIWIDAHMDSHTPQTSITGNLHGMPLACLLGYGDENLTSIGSSHAKIKPQNLCLIGVRSFETGEIELLKKLNVRIFYMDEVVNKGLETVMREAIQHVCEHTIGFGLSLDIDAIDPIDAPGTGVAEPDGLRANKLIDALKLLQNFTIDNEQACQFLGMEVVEFNPNLDQEQKTEKIIPQIISAVYGS